MSTGEQERAKAALLELSQLSLDVQQNVLLVVHLHCPKFVILIDHLKLISIALYSLLIGSTFLFSFAPAEQSGQYYVSTMRYFRLTTIHSNALRTTYIKPTYRRDTKSPPLPVSLTLTAGLLLLLRLIVIKLFAPHAHFLINETPTRCCRFTPSIPCLLQPDQSKSRDHN